MVINIVIALVYVWCKSYLLFALPSGVSSPELSSCPYTASEKQHCLQYCRAGKYGKLLFCS